MRQELTGGREHGASLILVAISLLAMLGAASLAIDFGMLYVARGEAQRAADAAALSGASAFVTSGCTVTAAGCVPGGPQEALARQQAEEVGAQNSVLERVAKIEDSDISFSYPNPMEPQITVRVQRTVGRGNAVPTLFARLFGVDFADVSATATAETFNPSGSTVPVDYGCVAPFLVPNCDPAHTSPANSSCAGGVAGYFINPATGAVQNPGSYPSGIIGEPWQLHTNASPSQWYLVALGGSQSGSNLRQYISECAAQLLACDGTIQTMNGKKVGPSDQGIDDRIHASGDGPDQGQDTIDASIGPPFLVTGGINNPNPALVGQAYYGPSSSAVVVPVYDGHALNPGGDTVTVSGFMQIFIQDASHSGNRDIIDAVILNVMGCNSGGNGGSGNKTPSPLTASGGEPIPVRLIRE